MGINPYTTAAGERNAALRLSDPIVNHIRDLQWRASQELFHGNPTIAERLQAMADALAEARQ